MKHLIKTVIHKCGITGLAHRVRNRNSLTIIMLHRVLPEKELQEQGANIEWTVKTDTFENFLHFIKRHYHPITFDQLRLADGEVKKLPNRALLLTFDDGWFDNFEYALPMLKSQSIPAHIFVASDFIGRQHGFWPEQIVSSCIRHPQLISKLPDIFDLNTISGDINTLISHLHDHEPVESNYSDALNTIKRYLPAKRQMLSADEIIQMSKSIISFGSHGASHSMMAKMNLKEAEIELKRSMVALSQLSGSPVDNLSFPHGSFTDSLSKTCRRMGLKFLFTSKAAIHKSRSKLFPRIHLSERAITHKNTFSPSKTAFNLFFCDHL